MGNVLTNFEIVLVLGLIGKTDWEAAQNDLVVTNVQEIMDAVGVIYRYKLFGEHYKVRNFHRSV